MQTIIASPRFNSDGTSRSIVAFLQGSEFSEDEDFLIYYDYPIYSDYDRILYKPDLCIWAKRYGFFAVRVFSSVLTQFSQNAIETYDDELIEFSSLLFAKFVKSKTLRTGVQKIKFEIHPIIYLQDNLDRQVDQSGLTSKIAPSLEGLREIIQSQETSSIDQTIFDEVRSIIEGAKVLSAVPKAVAPGSSGPVADALLRLEYDISNFDARQRQVALSLVPGPHRIRGLAGSGKTIILAAKAALIHLAEPTSRVLVTYYTRSLRETLRALVTRFYRHVRDDDPDWDLIHIRHGWGGANTAGVYADACRRAGILPLSFREAQSMSLSKRGNGGKISEPFAYACNALNRSTKVEPFYDYIFIDEGQDFPDSFYQLCYSLAKEGPNEKNIIWAYDELQNILKIEIRSAQTLFGVDRNKQPNLSLERAAARLPHGQINDSVLTKCYRNQREVLVTAHALGFGLYGAQIVQMLESIKHWEDVGYEHISGEYRIGSKITLKRPEKNSPISILTDALPIIECFEARDIRAEVDWAVNTAASFIEQGLLPHHIMIVVLDDRNAQTYLRAISSSLSERLIATNNLLADRYSDPAFWIDNMVTLSTVYRAKGNEAPLVIVTGIDSINGRVRSDRNKMFTAFTRSKAWLRVSGIGPNASRFFAEITAAKSHLPNVEFILPDLRQVDLIQRDLSDRTDKLKRAREEYLAQLAEIGFSEEEAEEALQGFSHEPKRI